MSSLTKTMSVDGRQDVLPAGHARQREGALNEQMVASAPHNCTPESSSVTPVQTMISFGSGRSALTVLSGTTGLSLRPPVLSLPVPLPWPVFLPAPDLDLGTPCQGRIMPSAIER